MRVANASLVLVASLAERRIESRRRLPHEPRQHRFDAGFVIAETESQRPRRDSGRPRERFVRHFRLWHEVEASVRFDQPKCFR